MASTPRAEYQQRLSQLDAEIARGDRRHLVISNLRLAAFGAGAVLAWLAFGPALFSPAWVLPPAVGFLLLLVLHARALNAQDRAKRARAFYERGLSRLDGTWAGSGTDGSRYLDDHPYARDLDLFGDGSLFQLLDTARTEAGKDTLAEWLSRPAAEAEIVSRQKAVAELRDRVEFREALAVRAAEAHVSRTGTLAQWAAARPAGFGVGHAWLFGACATVTAALTAAAVFTPLEAAPVVAWIALQAAVAAIWRQQVHRVIRGVDAAGHDLGLLSELLARIEREPFTSARLQAWQGELTAESELPSRSIARLKLLIAVRDAPRNEFVRPFALLLLARSQAAVAIDRWHSANRGRLERWLAAVGELEALASFGTYTFEHPADVFPVLTSEGPRFAATDLAHPLMRESTAVRNDLHLGASAPHVMIVSGSNMSGKSTLLRAVGANAVLALAGAPVRARALTLSPMEIGATIRVQDSLQEGHSRFYAEILRIRDIVERARVVPVLFLFDEILHGTNSHDRRIGAEAIVRTVVDSGAIGLITTHDLALTALAEGLGTLARNVHFEDRIDAGRMVFDYRMRDGVVEHSNALELMRAVGLDV